MNALTQIDQALVVMVANSLFGRTNARIVELHDGRVLIATDDGSGISIQSAEPMSKAQVALALADVDRRLATVAVSLRTLDATAEAPAKSAREEADKARREAEVAKLAENTSVRRPGAPRRTVKPIDDMPFMPGVEFERERMERERVERERVECDTQEAPDVR